MYLYPLVVLVKLIPKLNDIGCVCFCTYMSQLPFSAYAFKGIQFMNVHILSSESLLYKLVKIYLSACNLLLNVYFYTKRIKFKPTKQKQICNKRTKIITHRNTYDLSLHF